MVSSIPFFVESLVDTMFHYYLALGTVTFTVPPKKEGGEAQVGSMSLNALVKRNSDRTGLDHLSKVQTALQLAFRKRIPDPNVNVVDVTIANMMYLGHQTEADFNEVVETAPDLKVVE